ncbi:MAG: hypothetical protein M0D55_07355 [Elusimicrobiota bacterium]|nr:MAG: hypothetical protein M0D55_07355 [Elusimicrobiota bacterium]
MQIVDNTPQSYAPLLKVTLREMIDCAPAHRLKGIRLMFWEVGGDSPDNPRLTTRYSHKNGQAVVHVELASILRLAGLEWRPWALGRRAAKALSFTLANHALHHAGANRTHLAGEARRIQVELLKTWSERLIARMGLPSFVKRLMSAFVARRLAAIAGSGRSA